MFVIVSENKNEGTKHAWEKLFVSTQEAKAAIDRQMRYLGCGCRFDHDYCDIHSIRYLIMEIGTKEVLMIESPPYEHNEEETHL
jgi:hypothetical protein